MSETSADSLLPSQECRRHGDTDRYAANPTHAVPEALSLIPKTTLLQSGCHSTLASKQEPRRFQSCAVDTSDLDLEKDTVDVGVMTDSDPEELLLRERMLRLQKKFVAMEVLDAMYLKVLVKKTQPQSTAGARDVSSLLNSGPAVDNQPTAGPLFQSTPSAMRYPFMPPANGAEKGKRTRIFTQPLERFPFPFAGYSKSNASPSTPQTPSTPVNTHTRQATSRSTIRQPFLLNPGNCSFN